MKELEAKFRVGCEELDVIKRRIESLGFKLVKVVDEVDHYYNHPCNDFLSRDEALRVRVKEDVVELTYKGPRAGGEFKLREEYSVTIDSTSIMKILELLGFEKVLVVAKSREYYARGSIMISLDKVKELGCFLEIEIKEEDASAMRKVIESLGLSMKDYVPKTYMELLLEKS